MFGVVLLSAIVRVATETPEQRAAREREREARLTAEREEEATSAARKKESQVTAMKTWYRSTFAAVKTCDAAGKIYADVMGRLGNGYTIYQAYEVASQMKQACSQTSGDIRSVEVPSDLPDNVQSKVESAVDACSNAYAAKYLAADRSMEILDGDMRPSKVQEAKQFADASAAGVVLCTAGMIDALLAAGVEPKDLPEIQASSPE